jgi:hypothetical protein
VLLTEGGAVVNSIVVVVTWCHPRIAFAPRICAPKVYTVSESPGTRRFGVGAKRVAMPQLTKGQLKYRQSFHVPLAYSIWYPLSNVAGSGKVL